VGPARLIAQAAGGHAWRYVHTPLQWAPLDDPSFNVPSTQVEVLEPDGGITIHTFNRCGDLLDRRFRLSRDGTARIVAWTYGFDRRRNLTRIVQPDGGQEVRTYDDASPDPRMRGRLLRRVVRARSGYLATDRVVWRGTYEPRYQLLTSEIDESGGETRYRYDFDAAPGPGATGKLVEIEHPTARLPGGALQPAVTRFEANGRGQVTTMVTPRGSRHEIEYGVAGPERGLPVLRRYDAADLAIEERCGYDACGFLRVVTDGTGATRLVERDAEGLIERRVAPATDGRTAPRVTRHDSNGLPIAVERPRGELEDGELTGATIEDRFERDALGNVVRAVYGANTASPRVVEQRVRWDGLPVRITAPSGTMIQLDYDERGLPLLERTVRAGGPAEQTRRVFDAVGRLERRTRSGAGAGQDSTARCSYDAFGRIQRIDRSDGTILRYTWGERDLLLREEAYAATGDGTVRVLARRRYEYDARGRLVRAFEAISRADGSEPGAALEHQFYFDEDDDLAWIVDPRGGEQTFEHDGLGRVIRYIDSRGNAQQTGYDAAGRMTSLLFQSLEPGGDIAVRALRFEHDARGRWIRVIEPDGAEICTTFDDRSLPVRAFESGPIKRHRRFGLVGELIAPALPDPEDPLDPEGDLAIFAVLAAGAPVTDQAAARRDRLAEGLHEEPSLGEILTGAGRLPAPDVVLPDPATPPTVYGILATGGSRPRSLSLP
jgi:YD repeat-containing protein